MAIADGAVLICGLGALGQACLERLLPFDLPLTAVDLQEPRWRRHELSQRLCVLVQGDMRQARVLEQAGIRRCHAVLLLSADSQVNLEAALQVRLLNPEADVVVRSSSGQAAIGYLLEQRLPKVAVVDPVVLTAGAVACAIQPDEELIHLDTDGQGDSISVVNSIEPPVARPARRLRRPQGIQPRLWITLRQRSSSRQPRQRRLGQLLALARTWRLGSWQGLPRPQLRGLFPALLAVVATGLVLFSAQADDWRRGLLVTFGLLQGEYVDPVMLLKQPGLWQLLAALSFSLLGTLITSTLVALILERLLSERLGLQRSERLRHRGPSLPIGRRHE